MLTRAGVRIKQKQKVLDPDRVGAMLDELTPDDRTRALAGLELLAQAAQASVHKRKKETV
jgi:hypothetical protein